MDVNFADRLKRAREANRLKIQDIAATLGMSERMYKYYESGEKGDRKKIQKYLARLEELEKGNLPLLKKPEKKGVPVYNVDFTAGDMTQFMDDDTRVIGSVDFEGFRKCMGFVKVRGSSMYPMFVAGDYIGLERVKEWSIIEYGQPFAIVTKNEQRLIKIIRAGKDHDHLILRSINPEFDDIKIHRNDILELYKVRGPLRDQWQ